MELLVMKLLRRCNLTVSTRKDSSNFVMEEDRLRNPGNGGGEGEGYRGNNKGNTGMDRRRRRNETEAKVNEDTLDDANQNENEDLRMILIFQNGPLEE